MSEGIEFPVAVELAADADGPARGPRGAVGRYGLPEAAARAESARIESARIESARIESARVGSARIEEANGG